MVNIDTTTLTIFFHIMFHSRTNFFSVVQDALRRKLDSRGLHFRAKYNREELTTKIEEIKKKRKDLERRQNASGWERNLGYPLTMLLIILLTGLALFLVRRSLCLKLCT